MTDLPDINAGRREIPPGKVLLACPLRDRAELDRGPRATRHVLDTRTAWGRRTVHLCAWTPGWACAGSMMRWDNGSFGFQYELDGATHGRRFRTFEEAATAFAALPAT